jgi:hypothetical protein
VPLEPAAPSDAGLGAVAGAADGPLGANASPPAATTPNGTAVRDAATPGGADRTATPGGAYGPATPGGADRAATPAGAEAAASTGTADEGPTRTGAGAAPTPGAAGGATAPAGVDPTTVADAGPSFRDRGRLRRRLRFLRRLRELGFRDLGGLVFDQHRFGRPDDELVRGKLTALAAVDAELRALERALHDHVPITELREPGISACARCGAVIGSDARFCSTCGAPAGGVRVIPDVSGPATPAAAAPPADEQPTVATRPVHRPSS